MSGTLLVLAVRGLVLMACGAAVAEYDPVAGRVLCAVGRTLLELAVNENAVPAPELS
jgi:hypothetical protein